ncbi:AAA family ATPase, partial [Verrucomicrobiota bacterium]
MFRKFCGSSSSTMVFADAAGLFIAWKGEDMKANRLYDAEQVRLTIHTLYPEGGLFEVRAINATLDGRNYCHKAIPGYFETYDRLMTEIDRLRSWKGLYVSLNPIRSECRDRAPNKFYRADEHPKTSTADKDIRQRNWLLIDCDPIRPKDSNSTEDELTLAKKRANHVYRSLARLGWGRPVSAMSGNGAHLLYRCNLPADDKGAVKRALMALSHRFSDDRVDIDTAVFNPARITKLYGTLTCKGPDTDERPRRMSRITGIPEKKESVMVTMKMLAELAGTDPKPARETRINGTTFVTVGDDGKRFDLPAFIAKYKIDIAFEKELHDRHLYCLQECPWADGHTTESQPGESAVGIFTDGTLCFVCFHSHCSEKSWSDFRMLYEPDYLEKRDTRQKNGGHNLPPPKPFVTVTARELQQADIPPMRWLVPGWICEGLTLLSGGPKIGKSYLGYDAVLSVASGQPLFGSEPVRKPTPALYLNLEDGQTRAQARLRQIWGDRPAPANCHIVTISPTQDVRRWNEGGEQQLDWFLEKHPDIGLVVVDT